MAYGNTFVDAQPPSAELVMRQGPSPGQRFSLTKPTVTIGRGAENDVAVADHQVSRRHAGLTWDGTRWSIADLGSANGTYVNGVRLTAPQILQDGDSLGLGPGVQFGFQSWLPVAGPSADDAGTFVGARPGPSDAFTTEKRSWRRVAVPLLVVVLVLGCVLAAALAAYLLWPREAGVPTVLIHSPQYGEQVEVGREVTVQAVARDEGSVTRLELWVDDQLQEAQDSTRPEGVSPFPLVAFWQPSSPGTHTLIARAFNAEGGRAQASVNVEAAALPDRDGDAVPDDEDLCLDAPGSETANGCPDQDDDGIPDAEDACPDEPGLPEHNGCPGPSEVDRDGDAILDNEDDCPDEPGVPVTEGCPDADGDAISDAFDACPDEPGGAGVPGGDGCPAIAEGDRDGDGNPDAEDDCPDQAGTFWVAGCPDADGDAVRDGDDACPDQPGPPENNGCPVAGGQDDGDGDGSPDASDDCPEERGLPQHDGCPDRDGDGVPNQDDRDPDVPGRPEDRGGPDTGAGNGDGDGLNDDVDLCPEEPGLSEHDGCPPPDPGEGDEVPGNPLDTLSLPYGDDVLIRVPVVFELLEFEVSYDFDEVECYARLAGGDAERYTFEPLGERRWDAADLDSRLVAVPPGEDLEVQAECQGFAETSTLPVIDLGSFQRQHPPEDWENFREFTVEAEAHYGSFRARYRLCGGPCEEAPLAPPIITLGRGRMNRWVVNWEWDGDRTTIDGFKLYANGNFVQSFHPRYHGYYVGRWEPSCGERTEFHVSVFRGTSLNPVVESPLSNPAVWEGDPCLRTVRVTFQTLQTGSLRRDEGMHSRVGPVAVLFGASGSNEASVGYQPRYPRGPHLQPYFVEDITNILGDSPDFVTVGVGAGDTLSIFGRVREYDSRTRYTTLFDDRQEIAFENLVLPSRSTLRDGGHTVTVQIEEISGAGDGAAAAARAARQGTFLSPDRLYERFIQKPDLTIIGFRSGRRVRRDAPSQLEIQVSNRGGDLNDRDVSVRLETLDSGELIEEISQRNVTIAGGESRTFVTSGLHQPHNMRIIVDPGNAIDERDEDNNEYATPVRVRVEFLYASQGLCNENLLIVGADAEHRFAVKAGYGRNFSDMLSGQGALFPTDGYLKRSVYSNLDSPEGDWSMEGNERYTFEFDIPAAEKLFVQVLGWERDWLNESDSVGVRRGEYGPAENWGSSPRPQEGYVWAQPSCDDTGCTSCFYPLEARWRITRLE